MGAKNRSAEGMNLDLTTIKLNAKISQVRIYVLFLLTPVWLSEIRHFSIEVMF